MFNLHTTFSITVFQARNAAKNKQHGVVLFFALIALVAMSLAAVALIRSVDTNSLIAGNLSFKQSSILSADRGVETAIAWVKGRSQNSLKLNAPANGYYALSTADAKTLVDDSGVSGGVANPDSQGNKINYVVQRMCNNTGTAASAKCMFGPENIDGSDNSCPTCAIKPKRSLIYRITVKVEGPKNTVSYIQTFAY